MAMTVAEAEKYIEKIDNEVKNLQKLLKMPKDEYESMAEKYGLNSSLEGMVNTSVNAMLAYRNIVRERISKTKVEGL